MQDVLEDEKLLRWRHVEDVFKACLEDKQLLLGHNTIFILNNDKVCKSVNWTDLYEIDTVIQNISVAWIGNNIAL